MTLRVNVRDVWDRLSKRFKSFTRVENSDAPIISETLQPITNVDELLKQVKMTETRINVAATGLLTIATVPAGKRWTVLGASTHPSAGTYSFSAFDVRPTSASAIGVVLRSISASAYVDMDARNSNVVLDQSQSLAVYVNACAVAGDCDFRLYYLEEDAY